MPQQKCMDYTKIKHVKFLEFMMKFSDVASYLVRLSQYIRDQDKKFAYVSCVITMIIL